MYHNKKKTINKSDKLITWSKVHRDQSSIAFEQVSRTFMFEVCYCPKYPWFVLYFDVALQMLMNPMGGIVMTNDGNAILREIQVQHPAAKTMIEISRTQDEEVGDGTTSVIILGIWTYS